MGFAQGYVQLGNDIDGLSPGDQSGGSVALSADGLTVAIGSPHSNVAGVEAGEVRVFGWTGTDWVQKGGAMHGFAAYDWAGASLSLSDDGNVVAIGIEGSDSMGLISGMVRVMRWDGTAWVQMGQCLTGNASEHGVGKTVSLSGDGSLVAVAYPLPGTEAKVRVFQYSAATSAWTQLHSLINFSGKDVRQVRLSGSGALLAVSTVSTTGGLTYTYERDIDAMSWVHLHTLNSGSYMGHYFGESLDLSDDGTSLTIGCRLGDHFGPDYGFALPIALTTPPASLVGMGIPGYHPYEYMGAAVATNADGSITGSGAPGNDDNGLDAGQVRVFTVGTGWSPLGIGINGEAAGDKFGSALDLSEDGRILAVGAPFNDDAGADAGHVRIFEWVPTGKVPALSSHAFEAFPNPTHGSLRLSGNLAPGTIITVWDMQGRPQATLSVQPPYELELPLHLASGTYLITAHSDAGYASCQVMIAR